MEIQEDYGERSWVECPVPEHKALFVPELVDIIDKLQEEIRILKQSVWCVGFDYGAGQNPADDGRGTE